MSGFKVIKRNLGSIWDVGRLRFRQIRQFKVSLALSKRSVSLALFEKSAKIFYEHAKINNDMFNYERFTFNLSFYLLLLHL